MKFILLAAVVTFLAAQGCAKSVTGPTALPSAQQKKAIQTAPRGRATLSEGRPHQWRALASEGEVVIAAGSDGTLRRIDGHGRFVWVKPGLVDVGFIVVSSDRKLVAVSAEKVLRIVDSQSGSSLHELTLDNQPTVALPDGVRGRVYVASNRRVVAYDLRDSKTLWSADVSSGVEALLQSPTDGTLIINTQDAVQLFTPDGVAQRRIEVPRVLGDTRVSISASGRYLLTAHERVLFVHDLQAADKPPAELALSLWNMRAVRMRDDSRIEVIAGDTLSQYDLAGARIGQPIEVPSSHDADAVFGPDGCVVQARFDQLTVWRAPDTITTYELPVTSMATNEQHGLLALGVPGRAYVFDLAKGELRHHTDSLSPPVALSPDGGVLAGIASGGIALINLNAVEPRAEPLGFAPKKRAGFGPVQREELAHEWSWLLFITDDLLLSSSPISNSWLWSRSAGGVVQFLQQGDKPSVIPGGRVLLFADSDSLSTVRTSDGERIDLHTQVSAPVALTTRGGRFAAAKSPPSHQSSAPGVELSHWRSNDASLAPYTFEQRVLEECTAHGLAFDAAGKTLVALCVLKPDEYTLVAYDVEQHVERFSVTIPTEHARWLNRNNPPALSSFRGAILFAHRRGVSVYDWKDGHLRGEIRLLPEGGWVVATSDGEVDGTENARHLVRLSDSTPESALPRWAELRSPNALRRMF